MNDANTQATTPEELAAVTARVLDTFTQAGMLFTALDVSNAVKQTLPDIRHRDVAPLVRDAFERGAMGDYEQELIDVIAAGRKPAQAFLYHLPQHPADNYDDSMRNQLAIPPVAAGVVDASVAITATTRDALVTVGVDGRGRIPLQLLQNAGILTHGVLVRSQSLPPKIEIFPAGAVPPASTVAGAPQPVAFEHPELLHVPAVHIAVFGPSPQLIARVDDKTKTVVIKDVN